MSVEPYIPEYNDDTCVVCGKSVAGGRGYCHLEREGRMVALCSPLCVETFQKKNGAPDTIREANRLLHRRPRK